MKTKVCKRDSNAAEIDADVVNSLRSELWRIVEESNYSTPEHRLWLAVLQTGINGVLHGPKKLDYSSSAWHRDIDWFERRTGEDELGSFEWICDILSINSERIRDTIFEMIEQGLKRLPYMHRDAAC